MLAFVGMCSIVWLFWLSCQYLRSDWLERLIRGRLTVARALTITVINPSVAVTWIVSIKPRPKCVYDFLGWPDVSLFICVMCIMLSAGPTLYIS